MGPKVLLRNSRVLDVGSGSGFLTCLFSYAMKKADVGGKIVGIEYLSPLLAESITNVNKNHSDLLEENWLHLMRGDGWNPSSNIPEMFAGPYDAIHVGK